MAQNWNAVRNWVDLCSTSCNSITVDFGKVMRRATTGTTSVWLFFPYKSRIIKPVNITSSLPNTNTPSLKKCLRCNTLFNPLHNSPTSCNFHGHITGEKGLFALAPPHQGIDGEWTDGSGVIVYKWNDKSNRPNTGSANWKKRWSCCSEYDENAPPCQLGWHVSYDDGFTLF